MAAALVAVALVAGSFISGAAIENCREGSPCMKRGGRSVCHCWSTCSTFESGRTCDNADPSWDSLTKDELASSTDGCTYLPGGYNKRDLCEYEYQAKQLACNKFVESATCSKDIWTNVWVDMFSDDQQHGNCTDMPQRFIYTLQDGSVHVSGKTVCGGSWGQLFQPGSTVDPIITVNASGCKVHMNFSSQVTKTDPKYPFVQKGALEFTITYGTLPDADAQKPTEALKFNGLYNGKGGQWLDGNGKEITVAASACDNFWQRLPASSLKQTTVLHV